AVRGWDSSDAGRDAVRSRAPACGFGNVALSILTAATRCVSWRNSLLRRGPTGKAVVVVECQKACVFRSDKECGRNVSAPWPCGKCAHRRRNRSTAESKIGGPDDGGQRTGWSQGEARFR